MAGSSADWIVAVNACPYCGRAMPDRTAEDYRLGGCWMGRAWSEEFRRITTGYLFLEHCPACNEFVSGVEYQPELVRVEVRAEPPNEVVFDRWVAWYGLPKGCRGEPARAPDRAGGN